MSRPRPVAAVKYLNALRSGSVGIHARIEEPGGMAMKTSTGRGYMWELYRVEDDGMEQFLGYAEPWQADLLDRIVDRYAERYRLDSVGSPPRAWPLLPRAS